MATFYVLPSRPVLGGRLASFLRDLLPDVDLTICQAADLIDDLISSTIESRDVFVVFSDELPDGIAVEDALAAGFGAEPGDEIVEIRLGSLGCAAPIRRRLLEAA